MDLAILFLQMAFHEINPFSMKNIVTKRQAHLYLVKVTAPKSYFFFFIPQNLSSMQKFELFYARHVTCLQIWKSYKCVLDSYHKWTFIMLTLN